MRRIKPLDLNSNSLKQKKYDVEDKSGSPFSDQKFNFIALNNIKIEDIPLKNDCFYYEKISIEAIVENGTYRCIPHRNGMSSFALCVLDNPPAGINYNEHGLKIHISLDDHIQGNIAKGWNSIVDILISYNIARAKVARVDGAFSICKDDPNDGAQ